jgi:hypothetical protein
MNMKSALITKVLLLSVVGLLAARIAQAGNNYSTTFVTISNLVFYSASDDIYPLYDGVVVVNFAQPLTWRFGNNCATGAVAIRSGDKTLMTAVQTALATGRPIQVFADDAQTVDGVVCYLRAIEM